MIETPSEILAHWCGQEAAKGFCAWRKAARRPLTEMAALRIAKTLGEIVARGGDAADALGMAAEHGWQTIKTEWYFAQLARDKSISGGRKDGPDPALEQIARVAGLGKAPRYDRH